MAYLEELLPEFRKGAKIRCKNWDKGQYIQLKEDGYIYDDKDDRIEVSTLILFSKSWEIYKEPEPDWDYIIKNKCLCWFWDDNENVEIKRVATFLYKKPRPSNMCFIDIAGCNWEHCRPVSRDEITFYEDRKDEHI